MTEMTPERLRTALVDLFKELSDTLIRQQVRIEALEGEAAGRALMDAEGEAFLPEVVEQLQAHIEELERENGETYRMKADRNRGYAMFYRQKCLELMASIRQKESQ